MLTFALRKRRKMLMLQYFDEEWGEILEYKRATLFEKKYQFNLIDPSSSSSSKQQAANSRSNI